MGPILLGRLSSVAAEPKSRQKITLEKRSAACGDLKICNDFSDDFTAFRGNWRCREASESVC
jgi:hypothetical protein